MKGRSLGYLAGTSVLVALGWILAGQAARPVEQGLPTDWTHRHVIFSQPSNDAEAAAVMYDPRYWQQFNRTHFVRTLNNGEEGLSNSSLFANAGTSHADWSQNLGSGANAGAGVYPAKYSFQVTTANCGSATAPDFVVFSTGLVGSATQASVVAFDNLYSGCTGTVPQVYWAYNTGGTILTSPINSTDGKQVAFVQSDIAGRGVLVLLKWALSTTESVGSPRTLTSVAASAYRGCSAPCMIRIVLQGSANDTTSSVFPDYTHDVIWVGDALGSLHKFTGVFQGTPTEVITGGFPVQVNSPNFVALSSPVYDSASGNVFVGDALGDLYRVTATGAITPSGKLDFGAGLTVIPVVDSTRGKVYVFASSDGSTSCTGAVPCAAVYQLSTTFAAHTTGAKIVVGNSRSAPNPNALYAGGFDNGYFTSANATGNLYVCGNTGGPPTLYRIPINAGTMAAAVAGPALSSATTGCSPVADVPNPNATGGAKEWIFASTQASGLGNSCALGGCIMNFVNTAWQPSHAYAVGDQVLDTRFNLQTCRQAGTSRTAALGQPAWNATAGASTTDATVRWVNQGPQVAAHGAWVASHAYALGNVILDTNGNVQVVTTAGTSRTTAQGHPIWATTINTVTADASVRWRMVGLPATASLAAAGGTGGIIVDNIVGSGTMAGASQIYFSTQSNQACGSTGTGGCAMQASQSALQ